MSGKANIAQERIIKERQVAALPGEGLGGNETVQNAPCKAAREGRHGRGDGWAIATGHRGLLQAAFDFEMIGVVCIRLLDMSAPG